MTLSIGLGNAPGQRLAFESMPGDGEWRCKHEGLVVPFDPTRWIVELGGRRAQRFAIANRKHPYPRARMNEKVIVG